MNTRSPRLAVFDCDGTLVDSQAFIVEAMRQAWSSVGLVEPDSAAVRSIIGLPLESGIAELLPESDGNFHARVAQAYRQAFSQLRQRPDHHEPLFPGILEALDAFAAAGFLLAVATNKARRGLLATLGQHGLVERFVSLHTVDDGPGKPSPHMLLQAMAGVGAAPESTLMIGDTTFDMLMAGNAGVRGIGVGWGYHSADALLEAGALFVVQDCRQLAIRCGLEV
jgi:phosphoglycolate phosphatase